MPTNYSDDTRVCSEAQRTPAVEDSLGIIEQKRERKGTLSSGKVNMQNKCCIFLIESDRKNFGISRERTEKNLKN